MSTQTQAAETAQAAENRGWAVLQDKIETRQAKVGVMGLGYVGLPLALEFAKAGFTVTGFDVDPGRLRKLMSGESYIQDVPSAELASLIEKKRFTASTNFSQLAGLDAVIICVPTPLHKTKDPDVSFISDAAHQVAKYLHRNQLIVLESTTYPGTTREFVQPMLEKGGLKAGRDFYLAFSPERVDPGNKNFHLSNTPKVVGGITSRCGDLAALLYGRIVAKIVRVSSAEAAEMVKILENTFRAVNIGLVNEVALMCDRLGLEAWEVIDAAATKPFGFMPFMPGLGLGGHCIPVDPHYLSWKMRSLNFTARFIELADDVNSGMPEFVVEKVVLALNERKKPLNGSRVVVLGAAYKPDVSDVRESPALDLIHLLQARGAQVELHDPWVASVVIDGKKIKSRPYSAALLKSADAVVIATAHSAFNPREIVRLSTLVVDTRNLTRGMKASNLVRL
jgi:UDP-N-acetyl-D-glucosamine dehydrogenase